MKVVNAFIFLFFAILFFSCMSTKAEFEGMGQEDQGYKVDVITEPKDRERPSFWAYVKYESYEFLKDSENKSAKIELREPDYSTVPVGGLIVIKLIGSTIRMANGENSVYIIMDGDNKEIERKTGDTDVPYFFIWGPHTTTWSTFDIVTLSDKVNFPLRVRIVNTIVPDEYYEYLIKKFPDKTDK